MGLWRSGFRSSSLTINWILFQTKWVLYHLSSMFWWFYVLKDEWIEEYRLQRAEHSWMVSVGGEGVDADSVLPLGLDICSCMRSCQRPCLFRRVPQLSWLFWNLWLVMAALLFWRAVSLSPITENRPTWLKTGCCGTFHTSVVQSWWMLFLPAFSGRQTDWKFVWVVTIPQRVIVRRRKLLRGPHLVISSGRTNPPVRLTCLIRQKCENLYFGINGIFGHIFLKHLKNFKYNLENSHFLGNVAPPSGFHMFFCDGTQMFSCRILLQWADLWENVRSFRLAEANCSPFQIHCQ